MNSRCRKARRNRTLSDRSSTKFYTRRSCVLSIVRVILLKGGASMRAWRTKAMPTSEHLQYSAGSERLEPCKPGTALPQAEKVRPRQLQRRRDDAPQACRTVRPREF